MNHIMVKTTSTIACLHVSFVLGDVRTVSQIYQLEGRHHVTFLYIQHLTKLLILFHSSPLSVSLDQNFHNLTIVQMPNDSNSTRGR